MKAMGLMRSKTEVLALPKSPVTVYREDIYAGYRYFDSFEKNHCLPLVSACLIPHLPSAAYRQQRIRQGCAFGHRYIIQGNCAGKETVQAYLSAVTKTERPYQELKGFAKTGLMQPGEEQRLEISIPWRELAVYDEASACWILEKGSYLIRLGNSSAETKAAVLLEAAWDVVLERCHNRLGIQECNQGKVSFLSRSGQRNVFKKEEISNAVRLTLSAEEGMRLETEAAEYLSERRDKLTVPEEKQGSAAEIYGAAACRPLRKAMVPAYPFLRLGTEVIRRRFLMKAGIP